MFTCHMTSTVYLRYEKSAFEWKRDRQTEKSETGENKLDLKFFEKWGETFWN